MQERTSVVREKKPRPPKIAALGRDRSGAARDRVCLLFFSFLNVPLRLSTTGSDVSGSRNPAFLSMERQSENSGGLFFPNHQLLSRLLDNFPVCNFNNRQGKYKNHRDNIYFLGVIGNLLG
jgi:hypothetical protein